MSTLGNNGSGTELTFSVVSIPSVPVPGVSSGPERETTPHPHEHLGLYRDRLKNGLADDRVGLLGSK